MRRIFLIFILASLMGLSACEQKPKVNDPPAWQGKWVFVNYWASWCGPCREEIPQLNAFYNAHKGQNILVVGVNFDHLPASELAQLVKTMGIAYPVLQIDPAAQIGLQGPPAAIPATYVINPQGEMYTSLYGAQTQQSLEAILTDTHL